MAAPHLMELSTFTEMTVVITAASVTGFRLWVWLQNSVTAEHARTRRMTIALHGVSSHDRADIIRACAKLEAATRTATSRATEPTGRSQSRGEVASYLDNGDLRPPAALGAVT